jgi:alpha-L-rhamnosidase
MGEAVDLRSEAQGWDRADFDDQAWWPVETPEVQAHLVAQYGPIMRRFENLAPVTVTERPQWPRSRYILDLGQNMVGHVRLRTTGQNGRTVALRYAERLDKDGSLYTANYRSARSNDFVTLAGNGEETVEPNLTFHGFQFVEVSGVDEPPVKDALHGVVVHSDWTPTGKFECSEPLVNKLFQNTFWGWKGNSLDVPTDCPQRDERLGWTGDAQVFVRTATYLADVQSFFEKYVQDLEDAQNDHGQIPAIAPDTGVVGGDGGPAWADAFVICPWAIYTAYGDDAILRKHYPAMKRWLASLELSSRNLIRSHPSYEGFKGFGDWLSTNAETPIDLIGTAFYAHSAGIMAGIAESLGRADDAAEFAELRSKVKEAFQRRFVTGDGLVASGTQTAYVLALHFDLLPPEARPSAVTALVDDIKSRGWKLSTGFVGTPYLLHVLTTEGRLDVAYRLLLQKQWPSWLYPVTQGATTIWERWDGWTEDKGFQDPGMNSFNHYAYGAVCDWLFATVAGIEPAEPGYRRIRLAPRPGGGLTYTHASLETLHGTVASRWEIADGRLTWTIVIPANTSATVYLPPEASGGACNEVSIVNGAELGSGVFTIDASWISA